MEEVRSLELTALGDIKDRHLIPQKLLTPSEQFLQWSRTVTRLQYLLLNDKCHRVEKFDALILRTAVQKLIEFSDLDFKVSYFNISIL
jgi:hypothetical protein